MIPDFIQRSHILKALEALGEGHEVPARREAKKYDLSFNRHKYPPKYVVSLAHRFASPSGGLLHGFKGGKEVNAFLMTRGFTVVNRRSGKAVAASPIPGLFPGEQRGFWIVSPNVTNNPKTVSEWSQASLAHEAVFMGYGPEEHGHKRIGHKFAHGINPGDIVLIARSHQRRPEVVGLGVVDGHFKTSLRGFRPPEKFGSFRKLSPFIAFSVVPPELDIMTVLRHTTALRRLYPSSDQDEKVICEWMQARLLEIANHKERHRATPTPQKVGAQLRNLPHDNQFEFEVRTPEKVKLAKKVEAQLVRAYEQWLKKKNRQLCIASYKGLRCDAYEAERANLIEAKCSAKRGHIRMAVGQLLDYAYLGRSILGKANMAILLPKKPAPDLLTWLIELNIGVVWREKRGFWDSANGRFC